VFWCVIINIVRNTVARSYNCFKLDTEAMVKEVAELFKDDCFMFSGPVNTLPFTIPN
jgi:hypothetical protein